MTDGWQYFLLFVWYWGLVATFSCAHDSWPEHKRLFAAIFWPAYWLMDFKPHPKAKDPSHVDR